jgi:hypothetical protein
MGNTEGEIKDETSRAILQSQKQSWRDAVSV